MINLIKLEIKRINFKKYLINYFLIIISFVALITCITIFEKETFNGQISVFIRCVCTLVCSIITVVLYIDVVLSEYSKGTIKVLFMYPINRKKILAAKIVFVEIFCIVLIVLSVLFWVCGLYVLEIFVGELPFIINIDNFILFPLEVFIYAVLNSVLLLLPFAIGFIKKSKKTTIILSIIILSLLNSCSNGFSLNSILLIPAGLSLIALIFLKVLMFDKVNYEDIS